jgi:hypothetical protein
MADILPFADWRPDLSAYKGRSSQLIQNVFPRADGYGPVAGVSQYSQTLAGACRGFFYARNNDQSITVFAATANKLYKLNNTTFAWTDVSKGGGSYTAVGNGEQWQFAQFNNFVIAVQINTVPQVFDLTSSSAFADLGGSPPQARYVAVVNRFVVLSGLGSSTPYRIQWSGLNAVTTWTSGVNSSDFQDLPDGGIVRAVGGGETGLITQDSSLRRMIYAPGAPYVFQIDRVAQDKGIFAPLSLVRAGDRLFFAGNDGFYMILPGGYPTAIGKERFDRTFFADVDTGQLQLIIGASDPRAPRVYWAYKSQSGAAGLFDKILCYDYVLERASLISQSGEYLATLARPGLTLEGLDSISSSIDALTFSLDDVATSALSRQPYSHRRAVRRERRCGHHQAQEGPPLRLQRALDSSRQEEEEALRDLSGAFERRHRQEAAGRRGGRQRGVDADHRAQPDVDHSRRLQHNPPRRRNEYQRSRAFLRPRQCRRGLVERGPCRPVDRGPCPPNEPRAHRCSIGRREPIRTFRQRQLGPVAERPAVERH